MTQAVVQVRNIVARSGFANPLTLEVLVADEDYVKVYADTTLLDNGTDYEITGIGDPNGVSIEIIGAEDVDSYLGVISFVAVYEPPLDQQGDLSAGGVLGRAFETALDQQNRRLQAVGDRADRALRVSPNTETETELPWPPVDGGALTYNEDTDRVEWVVPAGRGEKGDTGDRGPPGDVADVNLFAEPGDTDATAMFNRATAASRRVYAPAGTYLINSANWPSNTEIFGDGDATILKMVAASTTVFDSDSGSEDISNNIRNLYMHDLQLLATCDIDGFSQHKHLVRLNGVSDVAFERVLFKGFRGDGVYIGSGAAVDDAQHNENVTFRKCRFDGINKENRQGISFIDIDGALIEDCVFVNCTKSTMPGAIDFEPNTTPDAVVKNVIIRGNRFVNIGGNVGVITVFIPDTMVGAPQNIVVEHNIADTFAAVFFSAINETGPTDVGPDNNYLVAGNTAYNGNRGFAIRGAKRVTVRDNLFANMAQACLLGYTGGNDAVRNVAVMNNRFVRCGAVGGNGLMIFSADFVSFAGNAWVDCGTGSPGASNAVDFYSGTSSYVSFNGDTISAPTAKTLVAIQKEAGHTFTPATNRFRDSVFNGLPNNFQAYIGDKFTASKTFNPGSLADGAGEATTVTLTGAALGDYVKASFSLDLAGVMLTAYVSAADTVTCRFQNESGGVVDLGSGTLRVRGEKQALL